MAKRVGFRSIISNFPNGALSLILPVINEHLILLILLGPFFFLVFLTEVLAGKRPAIDWNWTIFVGYSCICLILFLSIKIISRFLGGNKGFTGLTGIWQEFRVEYLNIERFLGFLLIYLIVPVFVIRFSAFKQLIPDLNTFSWDEWFMKADYLLHGGHHPWMLLQPFLGRPDVTRGFDMLYLLWFPIMFGLIFWMAWSSRRRVRMQFFLSFMCLWIVLGTFLALLFSSAGPCYYDRVTGLEGPYAGLLDYLKGLGGEHPLLALRNQEVLWDHYRQGLFIPFGGISAMPSMHVAGAMLFALLGWRVNRPLGLLLTAYAVLMQVGSVHLAWHYAIDGYLAIPLTWLVWKGTDRVLDAIHWTPAGPNPQPSRSSPKIGGR